MKTKIFLRFQNKVKLSLIILIVSFALVSCSGMIHISSSKAEERNHYRQSLNRSYYGAQNNLSPFTERYRAFLQKKYFGRSAGKKLRRMRIENSPVFQN